MSAWTLPWQTVGRGSNRNRRRNRIYFGVGGTAAVTLAITTAAAIIAPKTAVKPYRQLLGDPLELLVRTTLMWPPLCFMQLVVLSAMTGRLL